MVISRIWSCFLIFLIFFLLLVFCKLCWFVSILRKKTMSNSLVFLVSALVILWNLSLEKLETVPPLFDPMMNCSFPYDCKGAFRGNCAIKIIKQNLGFRRGRISFCRILKSNLLHHLDTEVPFLVDSHLKSKETLILSHSICGISILFKWSFVSIFLYYYYLDECIIILSFLVPK